MQIQTLMHGLALCEKLSSHCRFSTFFTLNLSVLHLYWVTAFSIIESVDYQPTFANRTSVNNLCNLSIQIENR